MKNFIFHNPTRIIFGHGQISRIAKEAPENARILIVYGGGSAKANGTIDEVRQALPGRTLFEFGGVEPNPHFETLMKAVELARTEKVDFLIAVGGGSVIDGVKFIAAAILFKGDEWLIVSSGGAEIKKALPFGAVLTLAATGSEWNNRAVVTKAATQDKLALISPEIYPQFAVLDPAKTVTVSKTQTANGVIDAFVHVIEQYLTYPVGSPLQDRLSEGLLLTLIEEGPKALADPDDYDVRANIMFAASMALNGLISSGVVQDWASHRIGHELTVLFGLDHAQSLAVILPGMMQFCRAEKREKLLQYASRVWGISDSNEDRAIDQAIERTESFFESLGAPTKLSGYKLGASDIPAIIAQLKRHGQTALGERGLVTPELAEKILISRL